MQNMKGKFLRRKWLEMKANYSLVDFAVNFCSERIFQRSFESKGLGQFLFQYEGFWCVLWSFWLSQKFPSKSCSGKNCKNFKPIAKKSKTSSLNNDLKISTNLILNFSSRVQLCVRCLINWGESLIEWLQVPSVSCWLFRKVSSGLQAVNFAKLLLDDFIKFSLLLVFPFQSEGSCPSFYLFEFFIWSFYSL